MRAAHRDGSSKGVFRSKISSGADDNRGSAPEANDDGVPAGLRSVSNVQILRMKELSRAAGVTGTGQPCFGVLDFPDMKEGRTHPAEDELARMVQLGIAPFIVVRTDAEPQQVLSVMETAWNMPRPGALFSIAGGVSSAPHAGPCRVRPPAMPRLTPPPPLRRSQGAHGAGAGSHAGPGAGGLRHERVGGDGRRRRGRLAPARHRAAQVRLPQPVHRRGAVGRAAGGPARPEAATPAAASPLCVRRRSRPHPFAVHISC
jgi:hypothetical protein